MPFARRPQREDPVEPLPNEEVGERAERVLVELAPVLAQRRDGGGERAAQRSPSALGLSVANARRRRPRSAAARVSGRFASSTHSTYSRRCVNDIEANVFFATDRLRGPPRGPAESRPFAARSRAPSARARDRGVDSRGGLHRAVHDDVPDPVVDARRRTPRVASDCHLDGRSRDGRTPPRGRTARGTSWRSSARAGAPP